VFFTVRFVTVTSVTHKPSLAPASLPGLFPYWPLLVAREAQAIFFRRRHQPRKPPLAKIRARTLRPRRAPSASSTRDSYKASGSVARRRLRRQRLRIQLDLLRSR
jgi:hypothetical protein